jgi:hypothetical protein
MDAIRAPTARRLFISYNNERDGWIHRHVVPILQACGIQILETDSSPADVLTSDVRDRIDQAHAVVGFMTLRDTAGASFNTDRWIVDEMMYARAMGKSVLEASLPAKGVQAEPANLFIYA